MRVPFLIFSLIACICTFGFSSAEVIRLKNGRKIWADQIRDDGKRIEYDIGDNTYAIPKSAVASIDPGGVAPHLSASSGSGEIPALSSTTVLHGEADVASRVLHDNQIDTDSLQAIAKEGSPSVTATAYFLAGKYEFDHNNLTAGRRYFETALQYEPDNSTVLTYYSALLLRTGNPSQALPYAQRAVRVAPESPDALAILGYVQFSTDNTPDAIKTWQHALKIRPDTALEKLLARAQREANTEANFTSHDSSHFTLRFEGKETSESFRRDLLTTLDTHYDDLVRDLGVTPRNNILVVLYTEQAFFDVTHAPSWSGAVNDGKLRIPISGLSSVTPDLARVLKHELAHSFINQATSGRCPQWLHEGVAQLVEGRSTQSSGRQLAQLFQADHALPFNTLEGSFMNFTSGEARLAYDQSLAAVEYISSTYGMSEIQRILDRIGNGSSTEAALRSTIHSDYRQLQEDLGRYLKDRYGS